MTAHDVILTLDSKSDTFRSYDVDLTDDEVHGRNTRVLDMDTNTCTDQCAL